MRARIILLFFAIVRKSLKVCSALRIIDEPVAALFSARAERFFSA